LPHPPSVPSSGFLPLSTVPATHAARTNPCESAVSVAPRRFAALFHAARVPGTTLQSFPFPRSRTRSRGPRASLRVSLSDCRRRRAAGIFAIAFPAAPALCLRAPPKRCSRRMSRDESSLRSLGDHLDTPLSVARTIVPSRRHWARRLAAGTPASKLCSPRESVLATILYPGQGKTAGSVLSWAFSPREFAPPKSFRVRYLASTRDIGDEPRSHVSPGTQPSRYVRETRAPTPGFMNPGSAGMQSRSNPHATVRRRPSMTSRSRRSVRQPPAPPLGERRSGLPAPPFGGAPRLPRPSRPTPTGGASRWTSKTLS